MGKIKDEAILQECDRIKEKTKPLGGSSGDKRLWPNGEITGAVNPKGKVSEMGCHLYYNARIDKIVKREVAPHECIGAALSVILYPWFIYLGEL